MRSIYTGLTGTGEEVRGVVLDETKHFAFMDCGFNGFEWVKKDTMKLVKKGNEEEEEC